MGVGVLVAVGVGVLAGASALLSDISAIIIITYTTDIIIPASHDLRTATTLLEQHALYQRIHRHVNHT